MKKKETIKKGVNKPLQVDLKEEKVKEQSKGLGDVVASITKFVGIKPCEECEKRRAKLNSMFPFLQTVKRNLTEDEIEAVLEMEATKNIPDSNYFLKVFNEVYGLNQKPCMCPSIYRSLLSKLVTQIEYQKED